MHAPRIYAVATAKNWQECARQASGLPVHVQMHVLMHVLGTRQTDEIPGHRYVYAMHVHR